MFLFIVFHIKLEMAMGSDPRFPSPNFALGDGEVLFPRGINRKKSPPMDKRGRRRVSIPHPHSPRRPIKLARDNIFVY